MDTKTVYSFSREEVIEALKDKYQIVIPDGALPQIVVFGTHFANYDRVFVEVPKKGMNWRVYDD